MARISSEKEEFAGNQSRVGDGEGDEDGEEGGGGDEDVWAEDGEGRSEKTSVRSSAAALKVCCVGDVRVFVLVQLLGSGWVEVKKWCAECWGDRLACCGC